MNALYTLIVVLAIIIITLLYGTKKNQEVKANAAKVPKEVKKWKDEINIFAAKYDVPADIAYSVLWHESAGNVNALGSAGEIGLMQLKPIAVTDVQVSNPNDIKVNITGWRENPVKNIEVGVAFLRLMFERTGNWQEALRAYNQGKKGKEENPKKADNYLSAIQEKRKFFT